MEMTLITMKSDRGHFKRYRSAGLQQTFRTPPVSTIVGMLKRIYGEEIKNFTFGYRLKYKSIESEVITTYKKVNPNVCSGSKREFEESKTYPCIVEYLVETTLEIVTNIPIEKINFTWDLNMGKTDCLCYVEFENIKLEQQYILEENVLTHFSDGQGIIERLNKETVYNENKGCYDYYTDLFRFNEEYECEWSCADKGFYLWQYNGLGDVECYKE